MARENINAGAATLAAMSQNVAQMGNVRNQSNALMAEHLNNLTKGLQAWQKDYDERKRAQWAQAFEQAKFDEQKRVNDNNIELAQQQMAIEQEKLPYLKKYYDALSWNANANANATHFNTQDKKSQIDYSKKQALGTSPQQTTPTNPQGLEKNVQISANANPLSQAGWILSNTNIAQIQNGVITPKATGAGAFNPKIQVQTYPNTIVAER